MSKIDDIASEGYQPKPDIAEQIPFTYIKDASGIHKRYEKINQKTGQPEETVVTLSFTPFDIVAKKENPDTKEVAFSIAFNNKVVDISGSDLSNKKGINQLAGFGVNTNENKAKELCNYITEYRALNIIPETLIYDRFGWKEDGSFVLGKHRYTKDGIGLLRRTYYTPVNCITASVKLSPSCSIRYVIASPPLPQE